MKTIAKLIIAKNLKDLIEEHNLTNEDVKEIIELADRLDEIADILIK